MKHLSGAPLLGRLLALPANIKISWKRLQRQTLELIVNNSKLQTFESAKTKCGELSGELSGELFLE